MDRIWKITAAVPLVVLAGAGVASGGTGSMTPGDAIASANGDHDRIEVGTYCTTMIPQPDGTGSSICADTAFPTKPPRDRLAVRGRERIAVEFEPNPNIHDGIAKVDAGLMRINENGARYLPGKVKTARAEERVWELRLPKKLRNANALGIFVRLEEGDADYLAGLEAN
jgi:hypothetical protein